MIRQLLWHTTESLSLCHVWGESLVITYTTQLYYCRVACRPRSRPFIEPACDGCNSRCFRVLDYSLRCCQCVNCEHKGLRYTSGLIHLTCIGQCLWCKQPTTSDDTCRHHCHGSCRAVICKHNIGLLWSIW